MKRTAYLFYAVVLWTAVEAKHAGRRSLDVEGKGSNLTQKQHQEVIHADVLQHFTTPPAPSEGHSVFVKDLPFLPEDINIQNLKNDDHIKGSYEKRVIINKENPSIDSSNEKNNTIKFSKNDIISLKYNQSGPLANSEVIDSHSSHEHSTASVVFDDIDKEHKDVKGAHNPDSSTTTESLKIDLDKKIFEQKKKEKSKKEIPDSVTVPTEYIGAGRIEKPLKDNVISIKLKEKNKETISEALDEQRSTTPRIISSSSISISDHDNKPLNSVETLKVSSTGTNTKESVNQSVNSVININGVISEATKKPRVKYSLKKVHDDNNNTGENNDPVQPNEDSAKNLGLNLNPELLTTHSPIQIVTNSNEKTTNPKYPPFLRRSHFIEPIPTKADLLIKTPVPLSTTVVKPSIAFKQQLANKLKGIEPSPTLPLFTSDDEIEIQEKPVTKSSSKSSLRKKPKVDTSSSEMFIPPTATAWTLASMKTSEGLGTSRKPISLISTARQTTITPVSRVKSFVPWSTRLLKNASSSPPTTVSIDALSSDENLPSRLGFEDLASFNDEKSHKILDTFKQLPLSTTAETPTVIRTMTELDKNQTELPANISQSFPNDIMIKDQSSTVSRDNSNITTVSTTEILETSSLAPTVHDSSLNQSKNEEVESLLVEKENSIDSKQTPEDNDTHTEEKTDHKVKVSQQPNAHIVIPINLNDSESSTASNTSENINEIKIPQENQITKEPSITVRIPVMPEVLENSKGKNMSEMSEMDLGTSDILVDAQGEEGKSGEESDEDEKLKQTTTMPPIFEPFETTVLPDLDEDEGDIDDDIPLISYNKPLNKNVTDNITRTNETDVQDKSTPSTISIPLDITSNGSYVTSFDIISKENTTQVVTRPKSEGDINWYNVDVKPTNIPVDDSSHRISSLGISTTTVTVHIESTIEPETTTERSSQETTVSPETTETAPGTTLSPMSTPLTIPVTKPTIIQENGTDLDGIDAIDSCVRIEVHISPLKLCHNQRQLRESIASQLMPDDISWEQIVIMGTRLLDCESIEQSTTEQDLDVDVCFFDEDQKPSPTIRNKFFYLYAKRSADPSFPIVNVRMIVGTETPNGFDNVLAAIILSVIAAICLVLLGILLVIIRKRQGRFNYGQRCTPVSLDDYSLDNISVYNSVRRKGALRASKRSYGNPGFDDPRGPSHPINFAGLANFSSDREALYEEFNQIPMITVKPDELPAGAEGKNRYANVIPLPETRVLLQVKEGSDHLDEYINANYIKNPKGPEKLYIACQAPLQSTVEDFWKMVWQQQTKVILMLTSLSENGVEKCADYLPQLEISDCHRLFGDFQVTLKKHEVREKYIISSLQLKNLESNLWREVTHLWYSSWPAQGVPEDGSAMIAFLIEARSYMRGAQGPTVVHCSPGTGRTGTVIAIDLCIRDFEILRTVDIPKTVYALRRDRAGAVQTKDQYAFIYQVLNLYATKLTGGALDSI